MDGAVSRIRLPELLVGGVIAAIAAFILFQGFGLGLDLFTTPMHHDDFSALSHGPWFDPHQPRPISTNIIYMLGCLGADFYYCFHAGLGALSIALSVVLAFRVCRVPVRAYVAALSIFAVTAAWLSTKQSVFAFQYLGLGTNLLSYCFATLAALVVTARTGLKNFVAFTVLVFLSAFSKEDMVFFLTAIVVIKSAWALSDGRGRGEVLSLTLMHLVVVGLAYGLSVFHSRVVGSAFTAGAGPYDLSNPLGNFWNNARQFLDSSHAFLIVMGVSGALAAVFWVRLLRRCKPSDLALAIAALLPFVTGLPYLLIPRFADYYAISFVPLALSLWGPTMIFLIGATRSKVTLSLAFVAPAMMASVAYPMDHEEKGWVSEWYRQNRTMSYNQIVSVDHQFRDSLSKCKIVGVLGVTEALGPFANSTSAYLDRLLGKRLTWKVSAPDGLPLGTFLATAVIEGGGIIRALSDQEARDGVDCLLSYSKDGRVIFFDGKLPHHLGVGRHIGGSPNNRLYQATASAVSLT